MEIKKEVVIETDKLKFHVTLLNEPSNLAKENLNKTFQKVIKEIAEEKI